MSYTPTKQLKAAFSRLNQKMDRSVSIIDKSWTSVYYGHNKYELSGLQWGVNAPRKYSLYHYGTFILEIVVQDGQVTNIKMGQGAYSASDRDNMNGLCRLCGIPYQFRIKDYCLIQDGDFSPSVTNPSVTAPAGVTA